MTTPALKSTEEVSGADGLLEPEAVSGLSG